jgi:MFS family permease
MLINITPLLKYRNYRYLYLGQLISSVGSMITYVALPYQIFHLTHSSFAVGMMGVVELVPLLITALIGGAYADSMDRKKLILYSEIGLAFASLILAVNAFLPQPHLWILYVVGAVASSLNGFHRPALESLTPRLVREEDIPSLSALSALKGLMGSVGGPALGGICIAAFGLGLTYCLDVLSFTLSVFALYQIQFTHVAQKTQASPLQGIREGFRYAWKRPELLGSYLIDFIAMIFGMPMALFPAMSEALGGAKVVGLLYSAPSIGALLATLFSGWTKSIQRPGVAITISALFWGVGITAFGFSSHPWFALLFLVIAGAADGMSGIFRMTLWNRTIPDQLRGRLAGLEMISYMSGPLLGNAESGIVAAGFGTRASVISGGALCILGVVLCLFLLPHFWRYQFSDSIQN